MSNNKRIAHNTLMLYFRMLLTMAVTLYTSRVVLDTLGIDDFGIYNVVGGVVVLFSFLNTAMATSTQRFLNVELGKNNMDGVQHIFNMSMTSHIGIASIVFVLAESVGLWFLNTQLSIPEESMNSANWVYQFSILTCCISIIRIPYHASIIAYETMSFYAYVSIVEVVAKLIIVYLLSILPFNKLAVYGGLVFAVTLLITFIYKIYCNRKFTTTRVTLFWNKQEYKSFLGFSGWSLFGSVANMSAQQGLNILLNIFYGVTVNAAMGITNQVTTAVYSFVSNFQTAFNPQIIKSYTSGDNNYFISLIINTSKYSYYLLLLIVAPIFLNCEFLLSIWLTNVPEYTVMLCKWMLVFMLIDAMSAPFWIAAQAIGNIRNYQIIMGILISLNFPIAYLCLAYNYPLYTVVLIRVLINVITHIVRILYLRQKISFPVLKYSQQCLLPVCLITSLSYVSGYITKTWISNEWFIFFASSLVSITVILSLCIWIGISNNERQKLRNIIVNKLQISNVKQRIFN